MQEGVTLGTCKEGIEKYEALIIWGGKAGIPLAGDLAAMGNRVALAEHKDLAGSCINFGCTPTKLSHLPGWPICPARGRVIQLFGEAIQNSESATD